MTSPITINDIVQSTQEPPEKLRTGEGSKQVIIQNLLSNRYRLYYSGVKKEWQITKK
jgi:hypothetical protein